jgi:hypothetical protein
MFLLSALLIALHVEDPYHVVRLLVNSLVASDASHEKGHVNLLCRSRLLKLYVTVLCINLLLVGCTRVHSIDGCCATGHHHVMVKALRDRALHQLVAFASLIASLCRRQEVRIATSCVRRMGAIPSNK